MIPKACKRLAEVDFPIAEVSRHAAREKSIRHGHPSTLHLWWARRPLASSRAVLMALLLPDPCDGQCPEAFKENARRVLLGLRERPSEWADGVSTNDGLRQALLEFIGRFASWDNAADLDYVAAGRGLVRAAYPAGKPLVVDPFAGGGSIPLEALRLGCEAFASDLNPVACLILKVMLEDIPQHGPELADELRRVGAAIKSEAEHELAYLYPKDPDGATPIAYLWARTVRCEAPDCGAEIPIYRSAWLSKRGASRARYFKETANGSCVALLVRTAPPGGPVEFRIAHGEGREDPAPGFVALRGSKAAGNNANVVCQCCHAVLSGAKRNPRVPEQLAEQRGGADVAFDKYGRRTGGARLLAVVTLRPGEKGRIYRLPTAADYAAVRMAQERVRRALDEWEHDGRQGLCPVPDEPLPPIGTLGFRVQRYGILKWGDFFTARQKAALLEFRKLMREQTNSTSEHGMAAVIDRCANQLSHGSRWHVPGEKVEGTFSRQALPIVWDYAEVNPFGGATGSYDGALEWVAKVMEAWPESDSGQIQLADATNHPLPDLSAGIWFTDPPYYDAVPYADLSDFFLVWLKRTLPNHALLCDPFDSNNPLSPKSAEVVQDETKISDGKAKDRIWFEESMAVAFAEGRRVLHHNGVGSVVFAHKTTEGWEALLSGMIRGGWTITGSWPIATEMGSRLRARDSAALATSIHLICRPRPDDALVGDWADVLRELPKRVGDWMQRLQAEGIRGADLVFACVGPAVEIYSRYSKVETAEGREISLPDYLEKVWEVVGREALLQVLGTEEARARNSTAGALEEDARLTALFLWTLQSTEAVDENGSKHEDEEAVARAATKGFSLPFDVVRRFAQPLGIHLDDWASRIIETRKGVVRLLPVSARSRQLFGQSGSGTLADEIESSATAALQLSLFPAEPPGLRIRSRSRARATVAVDELGVALEATTLDRVHIAMLFQASGRTQALQNLLSAEQDRGPDFLRLANALSALYPRGSQEKRLLDAMLLAVSR